MQARFNKLDARSQRQLVALAAALLLALGGALSWQVHAGKRAAAAALEESAENLAAMEQLLARYMALQQERGVGAQAGGEDVAALVNRSLQGRNFEPTRIQQGNDGELQVRLDNVAFADVLAWLSDLEQTSGLVVGAVSVSQGPAGSASVTLVLRGA